MDMVGGGEMVTLVIAASVEHCWRIRYTCGYQCRARHPHHLERGLVASCGRMDPEASKKFPVADSSALEELLEPQHLHCALRMLTLSHMRPHHPIDAEAPSVSMNSRVCVSSIWKPFADSTGYMGRVLRVPEEIRMDKKPQLKVHTRRGALIVNIELSTW